MSGAPSPEAAALSVFALLFPGACTFPGIVGGPFSPELPLPPGQPEWLEPPQHPLREYEKTESLSGRPGRAHCGPPARSCMDDMTGGGWGRAVRECRVGPAPCGVGLPPRMGTGWACKSGGSREQLMGEQLGIRLCPGFEVPGKRGHMWPLGGLAQDSSPPRASVGPSVKWGS